MCSAEQPTSSETSGFLSLVASHSRAPASVFVSFTNSSSSRSGQLCEHRASSRHLKPTARKDPSSSLQDPMGDGKLKPRSNLKACLERNKCIYHTRSPPPGTLKAVQCPWWSSQPFTHLWLERTEEQKSSHSVISKIKTTSIGAVLMTAKQQPWPTAHGNRWELKCKTMTHTQADSLTLIQLPLLP